MYKRQEQTFISTDNNSKAIINTRGECNIKIKHVCRVGENIQNAGYTQSRTIKKVTQLKQITHNELSLIHILHMVK